MGKRNNHSTSGAWGSSVMGPGVHSGRIVREAAGVRAADTSTCSWGCLRTEVGKAQTTELHHPRHYKRFCQCLATSCRVDVNASDLARAAPHRAAAHIATHRRFLFPVASQCGIHFHELKRWTSRTRLVARSDVSARRRILMPPWRSNETRKELVCPFHCPLQAYPH